MDATNPERRAADEVVSELLSLDPGQFARGVDQTLAGLTDQERGLLASALVSAYEGPDGRARITALGLDSADPSLMSRADVAHLLVYMWRDDQAALRRALRSLREDPETRQVLGGLFAPSRGSSDTGRLGTEA
jgi:hypothetical protein